VFDIKVADDGRVVLFGRFDASQVGRAREALDHIESSCSVHFEELDYISSAGLGLLLSVQKRLRGTGDSITLVGLNKHIREVFKIAGFDQVFDIE
jgi:anti-anti-sigma factor